MVVHVPHEAIGHVALRLLLLATPGAHVGLDAGYVTIHLAAIRTHVSVCLTVCRVALGQGTAVKAVMEL